MLQRHSSQFSSRITLDRLSRRAAVCANICLSASLTAVNRFVGLRILHRRRERRACKLNLRPRAWNRRYELQFCDWSISSIGSQSWKVKVAQTVVTLVPGEAGLRLLSNAFPGKIRETFDGLLSSYKAWRSFVSVSYYWLPIDRLSWPSLFVMRPGHQKQWLSSSR